MLVDHALTRFSTDNLSCMVVRLDRAALAEQQSNRASGMGVERAAAAAAATTGTTGTSTTTAAKSSSDNTTHPRAQQTEVDKIVGEARRKLEEGVGQTKEPETGGGGGGGGGGGKTGKYGLHLAAEKSSGSGSGSDNSCAIIEEDDDGVAKTEPDSSHKHEGSQEDGSDGQKDDVTKEGVVVSDDQKDGLSQEGGLPEGQKTDSTGTTA